MFCFYTPNPSIQTISKQVVIVWNRKLVKLKLYRCKSWISDTSLIVLNKIKNSTCLLVAFNLSTPSNPFRKYIAYYALSKLSKAAIITFLASMSTAELEIFFHVLVYSSRSIVASVRFKVSQAVVRSQSAVVSKIWTNWFNRANDWIGAIKAIALCSRGFPRGSL